MVDAKDTDADAGGAGGDGDAGGRKRSRGFDTIKAARIARRLVAPVGILGFVVLYLCFGLLRVPSGMDTIPDIPPGSLCVLDKRSGSVQPGVVVFVDLPTGGTLLTRIAERQGDEVRVRNDDGGSRLPDSEELGWLPVSAVRGVVLTAFGPEKGEDQPEEDRRRGR